MGFIFGACGKPNLVPSTLRFESLILAARALGTYSIFRYGAGPNGIMRTLGQYMAGSGATFGSVPTLRLRAALIC